MKSANVLYNACFGGYIISQQAVDYLNQKYGWDKDSSDLAEMRHDPRIVELFIEKGSEWMSGDCSKIEMVEIEADGYRIDYYDGKETVRECYANFTIL